VGGNKKELSVICIKVVVKGKVKCLTRKPLLHNMAVWLIRLLVIGYTLNTHE